MDPDPASIFARLALVALLTGINAFFAMSEIAVITLNENKLERLANEGNKKARRVQRLKKNPSRFLSVTQLSVTMAAYLASAVVAQSFTAPLIEAVQPNLAERWHGVVSFGITLALTMMLTYFGLVLGELIPRRMGLKYPQKIALATSGVLEISLAVLRPLVWVVSATANGLMRLFGFNPDAEDSAVTEEDIRMLVEDAGETGVIEEAQQEMIQNIFELDDINVAHIMTHRTDITGIEASEPFETLVKIAIEEGFSRIPVYEDDVDNIIGIVYVKDLLKFIGTAAPKLSLRELMRPAVFVPETKRCGELFKEMTAKKVQIAVAVDEHGGTAGLVSLEDVLESIVGNIQDEYDDEEEEILQVDENVFMLDGATATEEVAELVKLNLPEGDYDSIAGFVISELGYLPQEGEHPEIHYKNLRFVVEEVEDKRIAAVKVEILPREDESDEE